MRAAWQRREAGSGWLHVGQGDWRRAAILLRGKLAARGSANGGGGEVLRSGAGNVFEGGSFGGARAG